ncbi:heme-binding protein [uncultured Salegentibacter sp.]|uniref:GlcG/HbpS family heme-binding protein n=1 Tax=uncultured Salegentibacter sp. TaxID=259320 RepID=UPI0030DA1DBC
MNITLAQAQKVIAAAEKKSKELDVKMDIAVVDAGANLTAFARMDGAWLGSVDIAIKKAKTARFFDMNTGEIGKLSQPGESLFNIEHSNNGLITFPGGVPLKNNSGEIIGAVGVSGSSVENDHAVANYAAESI